MPAVIASQTHVLEDLNSNWGEGGGAEATSRPGRGTGMKRDLQGGTDQVPGDQRKSEKLRG